MNINQRETLLPEELIELGREMSKDMVKSYWDELTPEEKFNEFDVEPLLKFIPPEQRMAGLTFEQCMAGLSAQDILSLFNPEALEAYVQDIQHKNSA